jgi:hypothetical protein
MPLYGLSSNDSLFDLFFQKLCYYNTYFRLVYHVLFFLQSFSYCRDTFALFGKHLCNLELLFFYHMISCGFECGRGTGRSGRGSTSNCIVRITIIISEEISLSMDFPLSDFISSSDEALMQEFIPDIGLGISHATEFRSCLHSLPSRAFIAICSSSNIFI